jgi:hypothetical protein
MVRRCPACQHDSIVGHGRRGKQAHDESHDWIRVRRGICNECGTTFTLLPFLSLPYTHYSLLARGQALHRRFVEGRCWESAGAPASNIARQVAVEVFAMVAVGAIAGMALGLASARYIETLLFEVKATDLGRLALPSVAILVAAMLAALPAVIRAVRIDPVSALRAE